MANINNEKNWHFIIIGAIIIALAILISNLSLNISFIDPSNLEEANLKLNSSTVTDFYVEVAKGNIPGHSYINKFGHNPAVATGGEDIWSGGGYYNFYPNIAQSCNVSSTSINDANGGTGGRQILVYGLNSTWDEINETIYLDGTNSVNLNNTYVRMYRGIVLEAGSIETNEGNIVVSCNGTDAIYIASNDGQTQQAIYTIARGKSAFFVKGYVASADDSKIAETAGFKWLLRTNNGVNGAWQTKGQISLVTYGNSWWQYEYGIPAGMIPEKTDIRLRAFETTVEMSVVGGFDLLIVDNNLLGIS